MKKNPAIAVILPVFNNESTIKDAIESILNQDFKDFELIIINDGSNDNTREIVESIEDSRIKLIHQKNVGIAKSLNIGIKSSSAAFIARMDADDWSFPKRLSLQLKLLKSNHSIDVVSCKVIHDGNKKSQRGYFLHCEWMNALCRPDEIYKNRFVDSPIAHPSVMIRRKTLETFGYYHEGDLPEDYELWLRLMHHGVRLAKVNLPLIKWRDYPDRLSRKHHNYSTVAFSKVKSQYLSLWLNKKFKTLPEIWIWGNGKTVKQKCQFLGDYQINVKKYIDVIPENQLKNKPSTIHYSQIPPPNTGIFILSYVSDRKGRLEIFDYLESKGYKHGLNFYMMA